MRVTRLALCAGAVVAALAVSGCGGTSQSSQPRSAPFVLPSATASAVALAPALYMQLASSSSLFAIRASELAQERATSSATRYAAQAIVRDQTGVASQLSMAGRRVNLLPSASLTPELDAQLESLHNSADFDSDYRRAVGGALARSFDAHRAFAQSGSSPTLRPVAQMAAPVTKKNLDSLGR
jgi:predicted outer membrane protein